MADKLQIYNQALLNVGQEPLVTLDDDVESRRILDIAWAGATEQALNEGDWNFAKKTVLLTASASPPSVGFAYAFDYPADWLRTVWISPDRRTGYGYTDYEDAGGLISAGNGSLYLNYISNASLATPAVWPVMFWKYVAWRLAYETVEKLTNSTTKMQQLEKPMKEALSYARNIDARNEQNKVIASGSWMRSRRGGYDGGPFREVEVTSTGPVDYALDEGDV